jgi:hypothetical protein
MIEFIHFKKKYKVSRETKLDHRALLEENPDYRCCLDRWETHSEKFQIRNCDRIVGLPISWNKTETRSLLSSEKTYSKKTKTKVLTRTQGQPTWGNLITRGISTIATPLLQVSTTHTVRKILYADTSSVTEIDVNRLTVSLYFLFCHPLSGRIEDSKNNRGQ